MISKECSHRTSLGISQCSVLPAVDCGLLVTHKIAGLWDNWENHLDHTVIPAQQKKLWETNNLKSSLILVSWQIKNIVATLSNMAFKIRQSFHLEGLRNGETIPFYIKYEHSEIYSIIDNSRHCLRIKESWTGRPEIQATLSIWEKLVCASAFFLLTLKSF